jgi:predicted Zn-dependent protease
MTSRKLKSPFFYFYFLIFTFYFLICAPHAAEKPSDPALKQAEEYLEAWRLSEAEKLIAELGRNQPKSPEILDLQAWLAFYQGRYEESLRIVERSLALESGKVEKSYRALAEVFGYRPETKVRVEIAPDAQSFNAISTLSLRDIEETGAVGICKFNKIMTISPRALLQGYRWLDSLSHEYVHYVIVAVSNNKTPIWLHEGLARFHETLWRHQKTQEKPDYLTVPNETLLAQALEKDGFVGFKKMEPSLIYLETPEQVQLAYAEAASAVDFMIDRKGSDGIRRLMSELKEKPTPQAIETVLQTSYGEFEQQWKSFLRAKGLKPTAGSRVRKLKVRGDKEDEETVELKEIQSAIARNRAHLGDRMRERGRVPAAAQEYRRALQGSPHSTIILNKLARALIQLEQFQEALPHLNEAGRLDPDNVTTMVLLGRAHHATKNYRAARVALETATQINPFNPMIYQILYDAETAMGETARAEHAKAILEKLMRPR